MYLFGDSLGHTWKLERGEIYIFYLIYISYHIYFCLFSEFYSLLFICFFIFGVCNNRLEILVSIGF